MLLDKGSEILLATERAANDLRKGFPVIIRFENSNILVTSPETTSPEILNQIIKESKARLIITGNRAKFLSSGKITTLSAIDINNINCAGIADICGLGDEYQNESLQLTKACEKAEIAIKLVKIAELIPSVIIAETGDNIPDSNILTISAEFISQHDHFASHDIIEACRTDIALKYAEDSSIIAYRPKIGGREHYAIIVGKEIKDNPIVRVHSSCYTGDLLDSLECDCHDQLHEAVKTMHANGGGIILYILQEGRGIGLINKLRAYTLKRKGFDTVDANEILGFEDDERMFMPAVKMLEKLGVKTIRLLTNNPKKAKSLESYGIKVSECVSHIMEANQHNQQYLKTKSERLGHKFE